MSDFLLDDFTDRRKQRVTEEASVPRFLDIDVYIGISMTSLLGGG